MAQRGRPSFDCPNCGSRVPQGARSCPECGADDETGWSEDTMYDGLDLPDPGYGAEEAAPPRRRNVGRIVAIILLVSIAVFLFARLR